MDHDRNVVFAQMDATDLGFREATFDAIVCVEAAHHFPTRVDFLREAHRILRPGGMLLMTDLLFRGVPSDPSGTVPRANHVASRSAYEQILAKAGFASASVSDITAPTWRVYRRRAARDLLPCFLHAGDLSGLLRFSQFLLQLTVSLREVVQVCAMKAPL
jgi:ubiquinone/menaquinone biosynthesis C-methylase UbiE